MSGHRLASGGALLDRAKPLGFTFDGRALQGFAGDTLASALLASGELLLGRSFKYHRPRGLLAAGAEEPNALMTLGRGGRTEPNSRATMVELVEGLEARSQNRWPSLAFDVMAANGLPGPLLAAGFYYKTFKGPTARSWMLYEKLIRRAAGLGRASLLPDPDRYEKAHAFADVLVVGAGPAGIDAALAAARDGERVILADENAALGGSLLGEDRDHWVTHRLAELAALPDVTLMPRTTVWGYYDGNALAALERVTEHLPAPAPGLPRQRHWTIRAKRVVLATGAIERPVVFPGNDLPGVMLAGAVRRYLRLWAVAAGQRVAVFTNNDTAYRTALDLADAGITVPILVDARPTPPPTLATALAERGIRLAAGALVTAAEGRRRLERILIGDGLSVEVDCLAVSGGWNPAIHLASQAGGAPIWDDALQTFLPGEPHQPWEAVGAAAGQLDYSTLQPLWEVRGRKGKAFVDFQNDVTADDVRLAQREGFESVEHLKRYTTLGMATDQGKTSNVSGLAIMAEARGVPIPAVGTTRFRPPYTPVALGALAGREIGAHFQPERRTPMHDWHVANGAEMQSTGLWLRPRAYLRSSETVATAYVREARHVRQRVGIVDVSTLGKIDVQGPDAAAFLDRVYATGFASLPVGKARYGLMLRDDGFVLDDGTTWRLAETRYLMTTSTAQAGPVMSHLEFHLAAVWPELRVQLTPVSDQWAAMAVAGPDSRRALEATLDGIDLSDDAFPLMGVREAHAAGVPVLVARLSFSGERAYEVFCGARSGLGVWEHILAAGRPFDITPYGLEALGALRIEKGHVAGAEIDGRTTLADLGLGRLGSTKKSYVGRTMMDRPGLTGERRQKLVGLLSRTAEPIRAGAHLVEGATLAAPGPSLGHVTSWTYSPALEKYIALALLEGGLARRGQPLYATYSLKGWHVPVEVVEPCMVDPEGTRLHA